MPKTLTTEILAAAIVGFEEQNKRINAQIAELQQMHSPSATDGTAPTPKKRRRMSAAARLRSITADPTGRTSRQLLVPAQIRAATHYRGRDAWSRIVTRSTSTRPVNGFIKEWLPANGLGCSKLVLPASGLPRERYFLLSLSVFPGTRARLAGRAFSLTAGAGAALSHPRTPDRLDGGD
jgi:hypothetical protein